MQVHRFYSESITQPKTEILGSEARHAGGVLRLSPGQLVEIFDGRGTLAKGTIENISSKKMACRIENLQVTDKPGRPRLVIATSVPKGERFDWLISKCTELGIDKILPVIFERSVKQPKNPRAADRWRSIAISAAKQSKRLFLPEIEMPLSLADAISKFTAVADLQILLGSLDENAKPLTAIGLESKNIVCVIGPEGGLTEDETKLLADAGSRPVKLNDAILRIETAALAFAAILSALRNTMD